MLTAAASAFFDRALVWIVKDSVRGVVTAAAFADTDAQTELVHRQPLRLSMPDEGLAVSLPVPQSLSGISPGPNLAVQTSAHPTRSS